MKKTFLLLLHSLCMMCFHTSFSQTVSLSKNVFSPSEKIVVQYTGFPGNAKDWISVAAKGSADDKYIRWEYINSNKSGSVDLGTFPYGEYEIRGYFNNEYTVRTRQSFRIGNTDINVSARPTKNSYASYEKITIQFSGLAGNDKDWISVAKVGLPDEQYTTWEYTHGKQSGSIELTGVAEGDYEVRSYFNNESKVRSRFPFSVVKKNTAQKFCKNELTLFYQGAYSLGLIWGRIGTDVLNPIMITAVQDNITNAIGGLGSVSCINFDFKRLRTFSASFPSMQKQQAINEIDRIIHDLLSALQNVSCDNKINIEALYNAGIHIGAAQAITNFFIGRLVLPEWQGNVRNHLSTAQNATMRFNLCIPGFDPKIFNTVPLTSADATNPLNMIKSIHSALLGQVALSTCCCSCKN